MRKSKLLMFFFIMCISMMALVSCALNGENLDENKNEKIAENQTSNDKTRTIIDLAGNKVVLPKEIKRVVITSPMPLPSVYCFYRGSSDGLVGMHPTSMASAENSLLAKSYPEILNVSTSFVQNGEINIEEMIKLNPDVILYLDVNKSQKELFDKAGIPCIAFSSSIHGSNTIETYASWIKLLGEIFGQTQRSNQIIEHGRRVESDIKARLEDISQDEKPKAMIIYGYDAGKISVPGNDVYGQYWLDSVASINVAGEIPGNPEVSMEQIYEWNPEYIFITNFTPYMPEDFYNNTIDNHDWSKVKAVQEKKVFKYPLGMYRWYPPSSDTPLSLMWMAKVIHPDLFQDIDMDLEVKNYFEKYYNVKLSDEDLKKIYSPAREAGEV